jgi:hypothetical protein
MMDSASGVLTTSLTSLYTASFSGSSIMGSKISPTAFNDLQEQFRSLIEPGLQLKGFVDILLRHFISVALYFL